MNWWEMFQLLKTSTILQGLVEKIVHFINNNPKVSDMKIHDMFGVGWSSIGRIRTKYNLPRSTAFSESHKVTKDEEQKIVSFIKKSGFYNF